MFTDILTDIQQSIGKNSLRLSSRNYYSLNCRIMKKSMHNTCDSFLIFKETVWKVTVKRLSITVKNFAAELKLSGLKKLVWVWGLRPPNPKFL